jgi:hypothetical protein
MYGETFYSRHTAQKKTTLGKKASYNAAEHHKYLNIAGLV